MVKHSVFFLAVYLFSSAHAFAETCEILKAGEVLKKCAEDVTATLGKDPSQVFDTLKSAIAAQTALRTPEKMVKTGDEQVPEFPSFSKCEKSFFRVATVNDTIDSAITRDGWLSGWSRKENELVKSGEDVSEKKFKGLPPSQPFEDRIVQ